jgi:inorganic phosphate transporter, PiT family
VHDQHLYEPVGERPPVWWMRALLIGTCSGVSFAHGTNDGQKSIGLIMLTIIGLFPAAFALNPQAAESLRQLPELMRQAVPLVDRYGDDQKAAALAAVRAIDERARKAGGSLTPVLFRPGERPTADLQRGRESSTAQTRASIRDDVYRVIAQLKHAEDRAQGKDKSEAKRLTKQIGRSVEYAPTWVRLLSAICLGVGTMIGYRRIVTTLGERLGNVHLTPAQGGSAELISTVLIGLAGFTGLPVSTTHVVTSGIGGTMVASGAGLRYGMMSRILIAWLITLPVTILISGSLYYFLANPHL